VVQAVLLYGSETWVLSPTALARLEGFHIRAAYRMAKRNRPRRGPGNQWVYPKSEDVLEECGMHTIGEYIDVRRQTIAMYVATRPILDDCKQGERKRGAIPHRWWWEQKMDLDVADATGLDEWRSNLLGFNAGVWQQGCRGTLAAPRFLWGTMSRWVRDNGL